jgi:hypothetical protein
MIQAATDKSGQLQSTFNSFSETKLDMDKTMELAKNDLNYKNEILRNKLNAMEIEIGISLLPLKTKIAELKLAAIDLVNTLTLGSNGVRNMGNSLMSNDKYCWTLPINNAPAMTQEKNSNKSCGDSFRYKTDGKSLEE